MGADNNGVLTMFEQQILDGLKEVKDELVEVKLELARKEHIEPRVEALEKKQEKLEKQIEAIHNIPNIYLRRFLLSIVAALGVGTVAWFVK